MKIRAHLIIVVLATLAPLALLTAFTTAWLWEMQREAFEQRFLERVSALRLALDTEIESTTRILRTLSHSSDLYTESVEPFRARLERILAHQDGWATMGVLDALGREHVRADGWELGEAVRPDPESLEEVRRTRKPVISNVIPVGRANVLITFVVAPVLREQSLVGFLYVGIEHRRWLDMLRTYPIASEATLTLNDRNGWIIARTLNDENWAGKPSAQHYWQKTIGETEGVFQNTGLEGQQFYTAFSRLRTSSWVLGTGVPSEHVEAALRAPTVLLFLGTLSAGILACTLALLYARRIADSVRKLAVTASDLVEKETPPEPCRSRITEVEVVRSALVETSRRLREREHALRAAVQREAEARGRAEHESRSKDHFLAMLGHELRNPIAAISAATHVLKLQPRPDDAAEARSVLERQVRHLSEIVNDLLDVARLAQGKVDLKMKPVNLALLSENIVATLQRTGRADHVSLVTRLSSAWVLGDETRLEQIVGNLLENACKYTPAGGHVEVEVAAVEGEVAITVRDDGCGIAPELIPHVFDLFTQGQRTRDRAQGGLGLGLNVVRRLVELHGGTVNVASDGENRGSTFSVRLPRIPEPTEGCGDELRPADDESLRIVLVEDNADIAAVISTLLRMRGHDITVARDGPAGVSAILESQPDIALVDIGLPTFDGVEVARRVRSSPGGERPLLVALTGYGSAEERDGALQAGFDDFLIKPFDIEAFQRGVYRLRKRTTANAC